MAPINSALSICISFPSHYHYISWKCEKYKKREKKNESLTSDLHCFVLRQSFSSLFVVVCCIQSVTFIHTTSNHINKLNFPNNKVSLLFGLAWFSLDTTMGSHLNGHLSFDTFRSMLRKIVQKKNYNRLKNGKLAVPFFYIRQFGEFEM